MSSNVVSKNEVAQLVRTIREQVNGRSRQSNFETIRPAMKNMGSAVPAQLTENLRSISNELEALNSQILTGEPAPQSHNLRSRLGSLVKRRLYRFLWWQSYQLRTLADLLARRDREEIKIIDALAQNVTQPAHQTMDLQALVLECKRQIEEGDSRLRELESAQLRRQAAEIERNVRGEVQKQDELASVRQELSEIRDARGLAESQMAEQLNELAQRFETEKQQRELMAMRISELGLFVHQTRATLSLHDRRISLFIEEARKRLPQPLATEQLQQIVDRHDRHRYDSVYAAFEDVFRGSREEIKARQSVYLPLLQEHGVGSPEMPVLDLGSGRGEWLELLREHNIQARGVDRDEMMIERCKLDNLEVIQADALSYLSSLPDLSQGAVTSFHMVEHIPFTVVLTMVDEILRVLKPGGIIIVETPNPQNILVGSHTFYLDPTHLKPLPSPMLRFFIEARGFCDVHVRELHPYPETVHFPDDGKGVTRRLNDYLYGAQDYAVIGRKA
jgi:2-polyprenyl-3-methyl-5-hydroxy-6-metoxy-1,4-benzoquinol methylase